MTSGIKRTILIPYSVDPFDETGLLSNLATLIGASSNMILANMPYEYINYWSYSGGVFTAAKCVKVEVLLTPAGDANVSANLPAFVTAQGLSGTPPTWAVFVKDITGAILTNVTTILNLASAARASYSSGTLNVDLYVREILDINVTAITGGTNPTVSFKVSRLDATPATNKVWQSKFVNGVAQISQEFGGGGNSSPAVGDSMQIDMVTTGSPTTVTFSLSLKGRSYA